MTGFLIVMFTLLLMGSLLTMALRPHAYLAERGTANAAVISLFVGLPLLVTGFVVAGLRPETAGFDTASYVNAYLQMASPLNAVGDGARTFGNTELLWWPMQSLLKPFFDARTWLALNFAMVICAVWLSYRFGCRLYRLSAALFALVFATFFVVYAGNGMRQALSIPIGALAIFCFFDRRFLAWLALALIAVGLHWSSLVVLVVPVFRMRIFDRGFAYVALPIACLVLSSLTTGWLGAAVDALGISTFSDKYSLYSGGSSHVGEVWRTANFWLCVVTSLCFLICCPVAKGSQRALQVFVTIYLSLVLLGVRIPDFAERYLPALLFAMPLMVALMVRRVSVPAAAKSAMLLGFFVALGLLVYLNDSAQVTLGYTVL